MACLIGKQLIALLIFASLLLAGCLGSGQEKASATPAISVTITSISTPTPLSTVAPTQAPTATAIVISPTPSPVKKETLNDTQMQVQVAENKTGEQKVQEAIKQAVADGTYQNNVSYASPGGLDTVGITLSVKGDVVTTVSLAPVETDPFSKGIIDSMAAALPGLVVGKKITELNLPHNIAGSSLTTAAFKQYVDKVIAQS